MRSFFDFNRSSPEERQERNRIYPELSRFHIALREEMEEEEYQAFYRAEKDAMRHSNVMSNQNKQKWVTTQ